MEVKKRIGEVYLLSNLIRSELGLETLQPIPVYYVSFASSFYINTFPSKGISWVFRLQSEPLARCELDPEFVKKLIDALRRIPMRISLPPNTTMPYRPRYYRVVLKGSPDSFEVKDIVGVRSDLMTRTKWSLHDGYWHPSCIDDIINVLQNKFLVRAHERERKDD